MNLSVMIKEIQELGYVPDDARARVCQDIVLKAIAQSSLSRNVTIKGGILMRNMTQNVRRATQDMDIDFIRYSLSDESINIFVDKLNCLDGITIKRVGKIEELSQQDYNGKRVYIQISDIFSDKAYEHRVDTSDKRWLDDDIRDIFDNILEYLKKQRSTPHETNSPN